MNAHHLRLSFNAPLSSERAASLIARLPGETLLDLGCGWGELLHRWLDAYPAARAKGIDTDEAAIGRAREKNHPRATFARGDAAASDERADVIVCVGASHLFGGTDAALRALRGRARHVLFGDAFWSAPPTPALVETFGPLHDRARFVDACGPFEESTLAEWDAFEAAWSDIPERARDYQRYRGILGFAWVVGEDVLSQRGTR